MLLKGGIIKAFWGLSLPRMESSRISCRINLSLVHLLFYLLPFLDTLSSPALPFSEPLSDMLNVILYNNRMRNRCYNHSCFPEETKAQRG